MWTSVPQIVVVVIRITASPNPACGFGTSSIAMRSRPRKTTAFIVSMGSSLRSQCQDRARGAAHDLVRRRTKEHQIERVPALHAHHDQIRMCFTRHSENFVISLA